MNGKTVIVTDASFEDAYQVQSIPLMGLFSDGELVGSIVGARPKPAIMDELTNLLAS
jgi:thioredoxin-like negative regulator of GroEL